MKKGERAMKKALLLLLLFVAGTLSAMASETHVAEQPKPKYGKRKGGKRIITSIFKVKVSRFNSKIRSNYDNEKKKTFSKKGKKGVKPYKNKRPFKMRY